MPKVPGFSLYIGSIFRRIASEPKDSQSNMSSTTNLLPEWLERAQRQNYLSDVYQTLSDRDRERRNAQRASRHRDHPSATHRIIWKPAMAFKSTDLVDYYSVSHAYHRTNASANRYSDVAPYDRTRVVVGHYGTEPSGRYLNASWVRELAGEKWWIASQAPLKETAHAFFSLILQPVARPLADPAATSSVTGSTSRIRTVVQLTPLTENGICKADLYFPQIAGDSWVQEAERDCAAPNLKITLVDVKMVEEAHCLQSTVSIRPLREDNTVDESTDAVVFNHLFYEQWPDRDIPEDTDTLLRFVKFVDQVNRDVSSQAPEVQAQLDPDPPIIVGCSAGIGRTGTFIALSSILRRHRFLPPMCLLPL